MSCRRDRHQLFWLAVIAAAVGFTMLAVVCFNAASAAPTSVAVTETFDHLTASETKSGWAVTRTKIRRYSDGTSAYVEDVIPVTPAEKRVLTAFKKRSTP